MKVLGELFATAILLRVHIVKRIKLFSVTLRKMLEPTFYFPFLSM